MSDGTAFGVIPPRRAANEVITQVKNQILSGRLSPGDRLPSEQVLADQLGVSRPTVRESLRALISMNIVETRHGEGTFVGSLSPSELIAPLNFLMHVHDDAIYELFEARTFLETGCARLAATRRSPEDLAELRRLCAEYAENIDDHAACIAVDLVFHKRIAESSGNFILVGLLDSLVAISTESRRRTGSDRAVRQDAHDDHEEIIEAIAAGDPDAAESAMVKHLLHVSAVLRAEHESKETKP